MQFKCNAIGVGATFVQKTLRVQCGSISNAFGIIYSRVACMQNVQMKYNNHNETI